MKAALAVLVVVGVGVWWFSASFEGAAGEAPDGGVVPSAVDDEGAGPLTLDWPRERVVTYWVHLPAAVDDDVVGRGLAEAVEAEVGGPLGARLKAHVARAVTVRVEPIEPPALPEAGLALSADDTEREAAEQATHVAWVRSTEGATAPVEAFYAVLAAARVVAARHGGVLVDPTCACVPPPGARSDPLPADGRLTVGPTLLIPRSLGDRGMWFTTLGMARFGLPDLEMVDLPASGEVGVSWVLGAAGIMLAHQTLRDARPGQSSTLPGALTLTPDAVRAAWGGEAKVNLEAAPLVVGLSWGAERDEGPAFVRVDAPPGVDRDAWVAERLLPFVGVEDEELIAVADDDAEMAAAIARARAELPGVGARFRAGLPVEARLMAKAPWVTRDGGAEHLWFTVTDWPEGGPLRGVMNSRAVYVDGLAAGQPVKVPEADVEDWALFGPDGEREGGHTIDVLEARRRE